MENHINQQPTRKSEFRRVILESPYAGNVELNLDYGRRCLHDSLSRGEAPLASHLLYTQEGVLDDTIPEQRALGIAAGLAWLEVADLHVFYVDLGMSDGMVAAWEKAKSEGRVVEFREILK